MPATFPVNPSLDEEGRIRALVSLLGPEKARPVPRPSLDGNWDLDLEARTERTSAYAKLGVSAVFSGEATINSSTMVWDALVGKRAVLDSPGPDTAIYETFWGMGLRIGLTFRTTDINSQVSVATVASKAEYKSLDVQYEIHALGLGPKELAMVLRTIPPLGRFDLTAYSLLEQVRASLIEALRLRLNDSEGARDALRPALIKLSSSPFRNELEQAACYRFTMLCINAGCTLQETLNQLPAWKNLVADTVSRVFTEVVGDSGRPGAAALAKAQAWLRID